MYACRTMQGEAEQRGAQKDEIDSMITMRRTNLIRVKCYGGECSVLVHVIVVERDFADPLFTDRLQEAQTSSCASVCEICVKKKGM